MLALSGINSMIIKQSVEDVVRNAFVGKKFINSTDYFFMPDSILCDENDKDVVHMKEVIGKIIREVKIVAVGKYEKQPGILMRFDEVPQAWIFFDKSDAITVKE